MSAGNHRWASGSVRLLCRRAATPVFVALIALGGLGSAQAQDASPAASPAGSACVVAAEATGASPEATPAADAQATPVSDEAVIGAATTALDTYYSCLSETSTRGSYGELTVSDVSSLEDGSLLVDHQVTLGKQVLANRATLVETNGEWAVAGQTAISPRTTLDMVTLSIKVTDGAVEAGRPSAEAGPAVSFHGVNSEKSAQTFLFLSVPEKFDPTTMTAFDPTALPEGVTLVGELPLAAESEGDALFVGLEPGSYAVFAVGGDGTLATGTVITLTKPATLDVPSIFDTPEATPAS
ncbi:MAG: hypothetical protein ACR2OU_08720 [Thermomicrobiales bacterium]